MHRLETFRSIVAMSLVCFWGAFALVMSGCSDFGADPDTGPDDTSNGPTWDGEIAALLSAQCAGCHTSPPQNFAPAYFRLDQYAQADAPDTVQGAFEQRARIIARAVTGAPGLGPDMPPAPSPILSQEDRDLLQAWVDAGAPRN